MKPLANGILRRLLSEQQHAYLGPPHAQPSSIVPGPEIPWCVSWYPEKWELGDLSLCGEERLRLALLSAFLV